MCVYSKDTFSLSECVSDRLTRSEFYWNICSSQPYDLLHFSIKCENECEMKWKCDINSKYAFNEAKMKLIKCFWSTKNYTHSIETSVARTYQCTDPSQKVNYDDEPEFEQTFCLCNYLNAWLSWFRAMIATSYSININDQIGSVE